MTAQNPALERILASREARIGRLTIADQHARVRRFDEPFPAQVELMHVLGSSRLRELVLMKPRQVGWSLTVAADTYDKTWTADHPLRTLVATNHNDTTRSIFEKYLQFDAGQPTRLRRLNPFKFNRTHHSLMSTVTGARVDHLTVGGQGLGRSYTYQRFVGEEVAFWKDAENAAAGLMSTVHDGPETQYIWVSTPNGPGGFYHDKVLKAIDAESKGVPGVRFMFSKWSEHPNYFAEPPPRWEPTEEEHQLTVKHGLTLAQLYWRHDKIHGVKGIGEARFRREYPLTIEDGFIVVEGSWFDTDFLNDVLNSIPMAGLRKGELRIYERPDPLTRYAAGIDPAWCNGGDDGACVILNEQRQVAAILQTNQGGEWLFGERSADLCRAYGAKALPEANKGGAGATVLKQLKAGGVRLWRNRDTGKDWTTSNGNKEQAYSDARQMVNGDAYDLRDRALIMQLLHIREENGTIEGRDGSKDDLAMALVLAEQCLRSLPKVSVTLKGSRRIYRSPHIAINQARVR